jgi:hypothetical protein
LRYAPAGAPQYRERRRSNTSRCWDYGNAESSRSRSDIQAFRAFGGLQTNGDGSSADFNMTIILLFIVLGFILYANCLRGSILLDDVFIFGALKDLYKGDLRKVFKSPYRLLTRLSYAINGKFAGQDPYAYHVTNVCIHIVNSLIAILIFNKVGVSWHWSVMGGLFFLVHPLAVAGTAYVSGRSSLLSGFFVFLSILSVLHDWPILAVLLIPLAILSKEDAIASAVLILWLSPSWWLIGFGLIFGLWCWTHRKGFVGQSANPEKQPWYTITAITEYLIRLPLWLIGSHLNNKPHIRKVSYWQVLAAGFNLTIFLWSFVIGSEMWRLFLAMTFISPMLVYMVVRIEDPIMDYRGYIGLLGGIGLLLVLLPPIGDAMGILLACFFFIRSWPRVLRFRSPVTFWVGCMKDGSNESPYVMTQLAATFHMLQDLKSAEHWNKKAIEKDPFNTMAQINLARIYSQQQKIPECLQVLETCTQNIPKYRKGWETLRQVYVYLKDDLNVGRCDAALETL